MSDLGDLYRDWNQAKQIKRQSNIKFSIQILRDRKFKFELKNDRTHIIIITKEGKINFWPSTGLYILPNKKKGRGIFNLVKYLKNIQSKGGQDVQN